MAELEQLARLRPDHFLAYRLMGLTWAEDFRKFDDAVKQYRLALERNPPLPQRSEVLRELAHCLVLLKEFDEALDVVQGMVDGPLKLVIEIESYRGLGRFEAAQRTLDRLSQTEPEHQGALLLGAMLALDRGDGGAAIPTLRKLLDRNPHDYVARHQLSLAYRSLGDSASSQTESERMLKSKALHQQHDALYTQAIARQADADVRLELAGVCEQLGKSDDAARWRRVAAQIRYASETVRRKP
jgi:tetratricopeptide (TPR) repeat protein